MESSKEFSLIIEELSKSLSKALEKEDALQSAVKQHRKQDIAEYQADLLHIYRVFCLKMYRILETHLKDLDILMNTVHQLQNQLDDNDQQLAVYAEKNRELSLDKILSEFTQYHQKTGKDSKAIWKYKEK